MFCYHGDTVLVVIAIVLHWACMFCYHGDIMMLGIAIVLHWARMFCTLEILCWLLLLLYYIEHVCFLWCVLLVDGFFLLEWFRCEF